MKFAALCWRPLLARSCSRRRRSSIRTQPVRIVVPFSAGSNTDGQARIIADKLSRCGSSR